MVLPGRKWLLALALAAAALGSGAGETSTHAARLAAGRHRVMPPARAPRTPHAGNHRRPSARRRVGAALRVLDRGGLGLLRRIASADPFARSSMDAVLADADRLIEGGGTPGTALARRQWVPLVSHRNLRRAVIRTILRDMHARSNELGALIRKSGTTAVWDTVFVGAGVHTSAAANALGLEDPSHTMLVIESGDVVSSNFASLGETISINSGNRRESNTGIQHRPVGNDNPAIGPIGVPDLSGDAWPAADTLSDAATVSLHTSGADVLMGSRVAHVTERGAGDAWPARYKIEMRGGMTVYAASVVVGSGLGKPSIKVTTGADLIAHESAKVDLKRPDDVPGILYYSQAMALANQSDAGRDAYRAARPGGKPPRVAVIGGGDSGKTFVEYLHGLAPSGAYDGPEMLDRAQRGPVGDVDFVVGASGPVDRKSFEAENPGRYARVGVSIGQGKTNLIAKRFVGVKRAGKRFRVMYDDGSSQLYDKVVLATGFDNVAPDILAPVLPAGYDTTVPFTRSNALTVVEQDVVEESKPVKRRVAKQVTGQEIYIIGPAAGDDLVPTSQVSGPQMLAAIKFLVPYSAALARGVLPGAKAGSPRLDTSALDASRRVTVRGGRGRGQRPRRIRAAQIAEAEDPGSDPARTGNEPLVLRHEMASVLDRFSFARMRSIEVTVTPAPGGLLVDAPQLGAAGMDALRDAIEENYALVRMLSKFAVVAKPVSFRATVREGGIADPASLTVTY